MLAVGLQLKRNGKPMALWNRDCTDYPDLNLYGSHPFLLEVRPGERSYESALCMEPSARAAGKVNLGMTRPK